MFCRKLFTRTLSEISKRNITARNSRYEPAPKRKEVDDNLFLGAFREAQIDETKDWKTVREKIINNEQHNGSITNLNIDAILLSYITSLRKYDLASNYVNYLKKQKVKLNLATLGKYLRLLYYKQCEKCTSAAEKEILTLQSEINASYPVLDSSTLQNLMLALSVTKEWKQTIKLLDEVKITASPSSMTYGAIASAAFKNGEEDIGWTMLQNMLVADHVAKSEPFNAYLQTIKKLRSKDKIDTQLDKLLEFFKEHNIRIQKDVVETFQELSSKLKLTVTPTTINYKGECRHCNKKLEKFDLTDAEFHELKTNLFEKIIIGKDIFIKTNPDEMNKFKEFISNTKKFDVVLDGLNVAYSVGSKQPPIVYSAFLANVVKYFVEHNKKVLVLGRVHMNRWPIANWNYIRENSTIFLTQNISQDDPYLLYCALNSGINTIIVTRDLMRGHKFLLRNARLKSLFNRWLTQQQYQLLRMDQKGRPIFKKPLPFTCSAQKSGDTWHVPYDEDVNHKLEYFNTWLCLKPN